MKFLIWAFLFFTGGKKYQKLFYVINNDLPYCLRKYMGRATDWTPPLQDGQPAC